jgi:hypothetical protein
MDITIYRSLLAVDPKTNLPISTNYILSTDGQGDIAWQNIFYNMSSQSQLGYLPSTISTISTLVYNIYAGISPAAITVNNLTSTVSWFQDPSRYISTGNLVSTVDSFLSGNYSFGSNIQSTVVGLGSADYVSTLSLQSTVIGLGQTYISTQSLYSTINGLSRSGYVSSTQLQSTINGLGTLGYVSSSAVVYALQNLGSAPFDYISSASLFSTQYYLSSQIASTNNLINLRQNIYLNDINTLVIQGNSTSVTISTITNFYFYQSFFNSTIKYKGNNVTANALIDPVTNNMYVSTLDLQLEMFSNYIYPSSKITVDYYPNVIFSQINTNSNPTLVHVSSFITYKNSNILVLNQTKYVAALNNGSNLFQTPIKFNFTGNVVSNYNDRYQINHNFINSYAAGLSPGFINQAVQLYFDSTSSYYLSIQNIAN